MRTFDAALQVRSWAQDNNLMGHEYPVRLDREGIAARENIAGPTVFAQAQNLFRQKQILNIACNESASIIYVLTKKAVSKKESEGLPKFIYQNIRIEYLHAGMAQAGTPGNYNPSNSYTLSATNKYTCGSSIHPARFTGAGTIGCLVRDNAGVIYGLTNNHVSGNCNFSLVGEKILAPGHVDILATGIDPFTIGHHFKSSPFVAGVPDNINVAHNCDSALIKIVHPDNLTSYQGNAYDTPTEVEDLTAGLMVEKVGRTTGHTQGFVLAQVVGPFGCGYTVHSIGAQQAYFDNVFIVRSNVETFSEGGDSGSLVVATVDGVRKAVGLVFAGDTQGNSYVLPIRRVLEHFDVSLVNGHNV